jgi:Flp pilus assembly protein TadD
MSLRLALCALLVTSALALPVRAGEEAPRATSIQQSQPGRQKVLDELFERLAKAQDAAEARGIERAIQRVWMRSGSDTADLLMGRAMQAMTRQNYPLTLQVLDSLIEIEPDWAEARNRRAIARFYSNDEAGAAEDLAHALALEPKHFGALTGLGSIMHRAGFDKGALALLRRALELHPQQESVRSLVEKLQLEVEGREI